MISQHVPREGHPGGPQLTAAPIGQIFVQPERAREEPREVNLCGSRRLDRWQRGNVLADRQR